MNWETAYNTAIGIVNRDINLLFQRLNFFLITTAFMFAAFGTILTVGQNSDLTKFGYILCVGGLAYSILLASTNFLNSGIIHQIEEYIRDLENMDCSQKVQPQDQPYTRLNEIIKDSRKHSTELHLFPGMIKSMWNLPVNTSSYTGTIAEHTYRLCPNSPVKNS